MISVAFAAHTLIILFNHFQYSKHEQIFLDNPTSEFYSIRLQISNSEVPEYIKVTGKIKDVVGLAFGGVQKKVEFLGIPYSVPPIGRLRFQRPNILVLDKDFQAFDEPSACPQIVLNNGIIGNEDCLNLNVFLPHKENVNNLTISQDKFPVLVWFHGESEGKSVNGQFGILSSGSARELDPDIFLKHGIIVVTPQYRLGSLGFLSTSNEDLNGNLGLFDQLLALEWIQRFIENFGGDKNQITLMGHGSSAITSGLLSLSPVSKGLFQRIILMGGSPLHPFAIDKNPRRTFAESALRNACPSFPTLRFVRCMQQKTVESILRADDAYSKGKHIGKIHHPLPVIQRDRDGRFLPPILSSSPETILASGNFDPIPLIIGVTSAELAGFLESITGRSMNELPSTIFSVNTVLKQFIRAIISKTVKEPELTAEFITFEYFSGLNVTDPNRFEQSIDVSEELLSDYLYHIPALSVANYWSKFAPVYFYVFDYVSQIPQVLDEPLEFKRQISPIKSQATHGADIRFLMNGFRGNAIDRDVSNYFVDFFINFVHKGSPLHAGIEWPQFRADNHKMYIGISERVQVASNFRSRQEELWTTIVNKFESCSSSRSQNAKPEFDFNIPESRRKFVPDFPASTSFLLDENIRDLEQQNFNLPYV